MGRRRPVPREFRYRAIEIEQLGEKQVVQDLYALTRALLHLGDRIAWLSLLRAPWLGLSLQKMLEIAGRPPDKGGRGVIWELIKDNLFLERFTRIVAPAIANRDRGSLRERVEGVWLALGGPACVENKTDLEDAEIYLDELDKLEQSGAIHDPAALRESLERLYALPDVEATDDDLQIMTIHKAKGLEFDTVIVPGLDRGPGGGDPPLLLFKELVSGVRPPDKGGSEPTASGGLLLAPIKASGEERNKDKGSAYSYLRDLHAEAEDTEASRLLYVAATRAERHLHLLACVRCDDQGDPKPPSAHTLLARTWPIAEEFFSEAPAGSVGEASEPEAIYSTNRLAPDFQVPAVPEPARGTASPEGREEEEIEFSWAGETARHVGTVVHRWLERIAQEELDGWDLKRIDGLTARFGRELRRRGIRESEVKDAAELVRNALRTTISDGRGRWLLGAHPEARTEHRIRVVSAEGSRTLIIDRYIRAADGQIWVVDYKTSRHEGADVETFLDRERDRYAPQMRLYGRALQDSSQGLYFPLLRAWRQWDS